MESGRTAIRRNLKIPIKVFDQNNDRFLGYLVDITNDGFMLTIEQDIETEIHFQLKLALPMEIEGGKEFRFSATSRWFRKDPEFSFNITGFQFINLSSDEIQIVEQLIQKFCFDISSIKAGDKN
ncbi:PilZ domain-containing protein [Thermodesulfobacteriota bacterium]